MEIQTAYDHNDDDQNQNENVFDMFLTLWYNEGDPDYLVFAQEIQISAMIIIKMTGGTPEVRSDKSLTLMTFNIWHSTRGK